MYSTSFLAGQYCSKQGLELDETLGEPPFPHSPEKLSSTLRPSDNTLPERKFPIQIYLISLCATNNITAIISDRDLPFSPWRHSWAKGHVVLFSGTHGPVNTGESISCLGFLFNNSRLPGNSIIYPCRALLFKSLWKLYFKLAYKNKVSKWLYRFLLSLN